MASSDDTLQPTDIAVVGMAARLAEADTVAEYWRNLLTARECTRLLSRDELLAAGESAANLNNPNYVPRWAGLRDIEQFDAPFFGLSKLEGDVMDPQHRHFLETCVEALEDAGIAPSRFAGNIGVYAASGFNAYFAWHVLNNPQLVEDVGLFLLRHTGNDKDFLATRVAYCLGLRGPALNIQTACSSSLVTIHAACQALISRECDAALAGGVTIELPIRRGYVFREGEILAPDGRCRAFDADAQGTVFGSGAGVVTLRRAEDALADGDRIYAIIKGSAVNNDGNSKVGYLAPSVEGQARCVTEALAIAGVSAEQVGYVECHGTGTAVGDPIEVQALTDAFRQTTQKRGFCALSSVKPNIGHTDTAAGVASFIKAVKAVETGELAPTLYYQKPNPRIDFANTPFFVVAERRGWPLPGPRIATINSLGVGGTNAHVVIGEPPKRNAAAPQTGRRFVPLVWSAKTASAANAYADKLAAQAEGSAAALASSLYWGRERYGHRRSLAVASPGEVQALKKRITSVVSDGVERRLVFAFSGGGAAHPNMGRDLYDHEPVYARALDALLSEVPAPLAQEVRAALFPDPSAAEEAKRQMERPLIQLPAQVATQLAMVAWLASNGISPELTVGHSLGEYSAAYLAGVFDPSSLMQIVLARASLFEEVAPGAMLSVATDEQSLRRYTAPLQLDIAAVNGPQSTVAAGPVAAIDRLEEVLRAADVEFRRLHIRVAAHSSMLEGILAPFAAKLAGLTLRAPDPSRPTFMSNVSAQRAGAEVATADYWVRHLRSTVQFDASVRALLQAKPAILVDVGPGHGLAPVLQARAKETGSLVFTAMRHVNDAIEDDRAGVQLIANVLAAHPASEDAAKALFTAPRGSAPTYAFDHQRHWLERPSVSVTHASSLEALAVDPLAPLPLERWFLRPTSRSVALAAAPSPLAVLLLPGADAELETALSALGHRVRRFAEGDEARWLFALTDEALPDVVVAPSHAASAHDTRHFERIYELGRALLERDAERPPRLVLLQRADVPADALSLGVALSLPRELDTLSTRTLIIDNADSATLAKAVVAPALQQTERWRVHGAAVTERMLERAPLTVANGPPTLSKQDAAVVWGGTSGIGLEVALSLAEAGARVVIASRSPPSAQVEARLAEARAGGAKLTAAAADVTQRDDVARVLAQADAQRSLRYVVLAAGVLDDKPYTAKSAAERAKVLAPKQAGLAWHDELLGEHTTLVSFSSTSTQLGPAGQVDYVAANAVLDAAASRSRRVINWGMWREVGMAQRAWSKGSLGDAANADAWHPFAATARSGLARRLTVADWVLDEHRLVDGTAVLPGTAYLELLRVAAAADPATFTPFAIEGLQFNEALVHHPTRGLGFAITRDEDSLRVVSHQPGREVVHAAATVRALANPQPISGFTTPDAWSFDRALHGAWKQQPQALQFGPRWQVVKRAALNDDVAFAELELDERFAGDLEAVAAHPGLLDLATAFGLALLGDTGGDQVFVPVAYASYAQYAPMPRAIVSRCELVRREPGNRVVFNVTIQDTGGQVICAVREFTMRAVPAAALLRNNEAPATTSLLDLGATRGIGTVEGVRAFWTALASDEPQLYVSSLDLDALAAALRPPRPLRAERPATAPDNAPRDEIERQIASIFAGLLGATSVTRDSDFIALGGHSLLAVRLFNRIKKQFGKDLGLAVLFEASTVSGLATLIRGGPVTQASAPDTAPDAATATLGVSASNSGPSLVTIQRGTSARRPFFCVHGAGGNVLNFRDLVSHLDPNQPFHALQARGVDGVLRPHDSIESMARDYLAEIRRVQPEGPYLLGGYSGGGVVALEMAKQLQGVAEAVGQLVLLDTFVPGLAPQRTSLRERATRLLREGPDYLRRAAEWAIERRLRDRIERRKLNEALARGGTVPFELRDLWLTLNFQRLSGDYTMAQSRVPTVLFRAETIDPYFAYVGERLGWERWLPHGLRLEVVPGDHDSLVLEPNVVELGKRLDALLAELSKR